MNSSNPFTNLSQAEARNLVLHSQGFNDRDQNSLDIIQNLGYVQIDTLSIAQRAHHHVIHTKNVNYQEFELTNLMRDKLIFEYWSHAASYLPMDDFAYSLVRKQEYTLGKSHWFKQDKKTTKYVLDRLRTDGPLQSKDFIDTKNKTQEWYAWKPAKIALEQLFMEGKIMVAERRNFQKVYDLAERVLPSSVDRNVPTQLQFCEHLIKTTLHAQGIATLSEICYLRKGLKTILQKVIKRLITENAIIAVKIESNAQTYYAINTALSFSESTHVHILSPFDNLIIQRKRTLDIFKFNYQIECYVPEKKRKFGYYCLPILYHNQFIGRFDPKADRKTGLFTIKSFWPESNFVMTDDFINAFSLKLKAFILFCGCNHLHILPAKTNRKLTAIEKLVNE